MWFIWKNYIGNCNSVSLILRIYSEITTITQTKRFLRIKCNIFFFFTGYAAEYVIQLCCVVFFYLTGRLFEVREESQWQSRSQLGQGWPSVTKITSVNTAVNLLWIIKLHSGKFSWDQYVVCSWYCRMCIAYYEGTYEHQDELCVCLFEITIATHFERPHMDFFCLFDNHVHNHNIRWFTGWMFFSPSFQFLSVMCYTLSFLSIIYKVKLFKIEMAKSSEMSFL